MEQAFSFGHWLQQRRRALHLTQEALGQCVGCASETIRKLEADARRPSMEIAERLAHCLHIDAEERDGFLRFARGVSSVAVPSALATPTGAPPGPQSVPPPPPLPTPLTSLVGRTREVATVSEWLRRPQVRLVTLTGPGGVGKTRLALQVAANLHDAFAHGVWFVSLASLTDPELVLPTIGRTLRIAERNGSPLAQLQAGLHAKQLLLVLDNVEQVLPAAPLIGALLTVAPQLKILNTSRVALRLSGEQEFPVPPLGLPARRPPPPLATLSQYDAVALFIQRAQAVKPDFQVTNANAPAIADICHRLDGLPLAIELAAARAKLLAPEELLARLTHRLTLLTRGARDLPARQQTLRATIAWSYQLLAAGEQLLLARMAVFVNSWTLEAAEAVCNTNGDLPLAVLDGLHALLDHNLLHHAPASTGSMRFTMLETIGEYAWERLEEHGEADRLQERHAAYYLAVAEEAEPHLQGADQQQWLDRLLQDQDNFRRALRWALDHGQPELALRLSGALWYFWFMRGYLHEGRQWLEAALAQRVEQDPVVRVKALTGAGLLQFMQADATRPTALLQESLALGRALGDRPAIAVALLGLGAVALNQGAFGEAATHLEESQALFRDLGQTWGTAAALFCLGRALFLAGDAAQAAAQIEASYPLAAQVGDRFGMVWMRTTLGYVRYQQGDNTAAVGHFRESLTIAADLGAMQVVAECLEGLASVAGGMGDGARAARLFGAAETLREAIGAPLAPADRANYGRSVDTARRSVDAATFTTAWADGQTMTLEQAIAYALATDQTD